MSADVALSGAGRFPRFRARAGSWLGRLVAEVAPECDSVDVRFAGDRTVRRLNRTSAARTSRPMCSPFRALESPEGRHLGDIVISIPTAERQASRRGAALEEEVKLLLLHGVLHCLGHDHETDAGEMERLEVRLRHRWLGCR